MTVTFEIDWQSAETLIAQLRKDSHFSDGTADYDDLIDELRRGLENEAERIGMLKAEVSQ